MHAHAVCLQSRLSVGSAATRPVGGSIALEASPLRLGIPHHDQKLSETRTDFIHAVRLEQAQVNVFKLSVVRQSLYPDLQGVLPVYEHDSQPPCRRGGSVRFLDNFWVAGGSAATFMPATIY
jgi:hypothetical protein